MGVQRLLLNPCSFLKKKKWSMNGEDLILLYTVHMYLTYAYFLSFCMHFPTSTLNLMGKTALLYIDLWLSRFPVYSMARSVCLGLNSSICPVVV